jgi:purine-nucleoside phosphorylase
MDKKLKLVNASFANPAGSQLITGVQEKASRLGLKVSEALRIGALLFWRCDTETVWELLAETRLLNRSDPNKKTK